MAKKSDFVVVMVVQGEVRANVIKSHLESEGIPVMLKYEGAGRIYGILADGMGEVKILVPEDWADEARHIIEPVEPPENEN